MSPKQQYTGVQAEAPAAPCIVSNEDMQSFRADISSMRADMADIRSAVIGNEKYGQPGLVARMTRTERVLLVISFCLVVLGGDRIVKLFL